MGFKMVMGRNLAYDSTRLRSVLVSLGIGWLACSCTEAVDGANQAIRSSDGELDASSACAESKSDCGGRTPGGSGTAGAGGATDAGVIPPSGMGGSGSSGASEAGVVGDGSAQAPDASGDAASAGVSCVSTRELAPAFEGVDLEISGSGFDAYSGEVVRLLISTNGDVNAIASEVVVAGAFRFELSRAVSDYSNLSLYIDQNADDGCDDGEPTWSFTTGPGGCSRQPCPPPGGLVAYNLRLPLRDCTDCGPWRPHPRVAIGVNIHCETGAGVDLSAPVPCPL